MTALNSAWREPRGSSRQSLGNSALTMAAIMGLIAMLVGLFTDFVSSAPFLILVGLISFCLSWVDIRVGLAAILIAMGLSPDVQTGGISVRVEDFIIPFVILIWISRSLLNREKFLSANLGAPIGCYFVIATIATFNGVMTVTYYLYTPVALKHYLKNAEYFLLFFLVANCIKNLKDIKFFVKLSLLVAGALAIYGTHLVITRGEVHGMVRLHGPSGETGNILGAYYVFHMCLALGLMVTLKELKYRVLLFLYLAVIMFFPFLQTFSRASFVSLIFAISVLGMVTDRRIIYVCLGLVFIMPLIFPAEIYERLHTILGVAGLRGEDMPSSIQSKIDGWVWAFSYMFIDRPWLGSGMGSVGLGGVDNEYFKIALEVGVLGLLAFLWFIKRCFTLAWNLFKDVEDRFLAGTLLGYMAGLISMLVHALTATTFTAIRTMEIFMFITGLVAAMRIRINQINIEAAHERQKLLESSIIKDQNAGSIKGLSMPQEEKPLVAHFRKQQSQH